VQHMVTEIQKQEEREMKFDEKYNVKKNWDQPAIFLFFFFFFALCLSVFPFPKRVHCSTFTLISLQLTVIELNRTTNPKRKQRKTNDFWVFFFFLFTPKKFSSPAKHNSLSNLQFVFAFWVQFEEKKKNGFVGCLFFVQFCL
jgi:hypothetical protein